MAKLIGISKRELDVLEKWEETGSIAGAADALNLPYSTASGRMTRLKQRYKDAKSFVREVEKWNARLPGALE